MDRIEAFSTSISEGYAMQGDSIILGGAMFGGQAVQAVTADKSPGAIEDNEQAWTYCGRNRDR